MKIVLLAVLLALTACSAKSQPATDAERIALEGIDARLQLLGERSAAITSDRRVGALLNEALSIGATNAKLLESVRSRTGLANPVYSHGSWLPPELAPATSVTAPH